jgi:hypothetical protein
MISNAAAINYKKNRNVNIGRLESGPIHGYIFWELAGKFILVFGCGTS